MSEKILRRDFLKWTAAGATAPALGGAKPSSSFSAFETVPLGTCGIKTTRLCFGTGVRSFNRTSELTRKGIPYMVQLLREAYLRGIRCFDLADLYGSHQPITEALKGFPRESYTLITKVWWRRGGIPEQDRTDTAGLIERFLRELKTDYIDLVQLHCVDNGTWATDLAKEMEALDKAKKQGKIRAHGISIHAFSALHAAADVPWLDAAHVRINPFGKKMAGPVEKNVHEIKRMRAKGKGIIAMKVLGEGDLSKEPEKIDQSLAFLLQNEIADILNIGFLKLEQIDDIATRIAKIKRSPTA